MVLLNFLCFATSVSDRAFVKILIKIPGLFHQSGLLSDIGIVNRPLLLYIVSNSGINPIHHYLNELFDLCNKF